MQRREALKAGLFCLGPAALWPVGAIAEFAPDAHSLRAKLALALRSIDNDACAEAAKRLEQATPEQGVRLQLRDAGLTFSDTVKISNVLRSLSTSEARGLLSFSLSFNKNIGDAGALQLTRALPTQLPELGLVGCKIGDTGGTALLDWATRASHLRMLCIEGNDFSAALATRFRDLVKIRSRINVYV